MFPCSIPTTNAPGAMPRNQARKRGSAEEIETGIAGIVGGQSLTGRFVDAETETWRLQHRNAGIHSYTPSPRQVVILGNTCLSHF